MPAKNRSKDEIGKLQDDLQDLKTQEGIEGYILRGPKAASVDLKDATKIGDYAVLSATAYEKAQAILDAFEVGKIATIVLEGANTKVLLTTTGEDHLSVFMEKTVDHTKLCEDLELS